VFWVACLEFGQESLPTSFGKQEKFNWAMWTLQFDEAKLANRKLELDKIGKNRVTAIWTSQVGRVSSLTCVWNTKCLGFFFGQVHFFLFAHFTLKKKAPKQRREKETRGKDQSPGQQTAQKKQATRRKGNH